MTKTGKKYLKLIKKELPWRCEYRKEFIRFVEKQVEEYCSEHPDATMDGLFEAVGKPEELAIELVGEMDFDVLKRSARVSKAVIIILTAVAVFGVLFYTLTYLFSPTMTDGYFEDEIVITYQSIDE